MLKQKNLFTKLCLSCLFLLLFSFNSFAFELNDYELYSDGQVKQDDYGSLREVRLDNDIF